MICFCNTTWVVGFVYLQPYWIPLGSYTNSFFYIFISLFYRTEFETGKNIFICYEINITTFKPFDFQNIWQGIALMLQCFTYHNFSDQSHPDHKLLLEAQKEIHDLLELINCTERESLELEQQQQTLRELEQMIEGLSNLVTLDRMFLRHETVTMPSAQGTIKDRALFLFNDTLLITSVKRRTGTIKKPTP